MNKPKTNNELFIKKYNELDNLIDNIYHLDDNDSAIIFLINKNCFVVITIFETF